MTTMVNNDGLCARCRCRHCGDASDAVSTRAAAVGKTTASAILELLHPLHFTRRISGLPKCDTYDTL